MPQIDRRNASLVRARGRPREFDIDDALDKAVRVFSERGYHATSIGDLAGAMELASGSIYKAFRDKRAVFLAAFDNRFGMIIPGDHIGAAGEKRARTRKAGSAETEKCQAFAGKRGDGDHARGVIEITSAWVRRWDLDASVGRWKVLLNEGRALR